MSVVVVTNISEIILPGESLSRHLKELLLKFFEDAALSTKQLFEETQATWEHKAVFEIEWNDRVAFRNLSFTVGTDDINYSRVNDGTQAHYILPLGGVEGTNFLTFRKNGMPKTQPGVIDSSSGQRGDEFISVRSILHPGIEPRRFDEVIAAELEEYLADEFERRMLSFFP